MLRLDDVINPVDRQIFTDHFSKMQRNKFFSPVHETFSKINHRLGHKAILNKYKKIDMTPCILPDEDRLKMDINNNRNLETHGN